ncbi:hypothetical protein B4102_3589 [Heyndrickxia sporothermodurans]|uniref:Uncharacterized protein n=1 Tax=Heyndrickxia sporothermodurans TaxID=46224 RepID=A0A150KNZ6_9BACI|nr:hypothetical protein [Heyndrickxia sporothermodurans]KYC94368.1 hypothetical protein B4102_3589 [Heyndrickxia sporothermodurans]
MSLFGYPADIIHNVAVIDNWNRVTGYFPLPLKAKVVEEQKLIKNDKGEDVISIGEIHLEGAHEISPQDYFLYTNALGKEIRYNVKHIEIKKNLGTDDVRKVVVYG